MEETGSRITIRWTGLIALDLAEEIEHLLTLHNYECNDRGRDLDGDQERVLVFRVAKGQ